MSRAIELPDGKGLVADQARNNQLVRHQWRVLYLTTQDLEHDPEKVGRELLQTIEALSASPVTAA